MEGLLPLVYKAIKHNRTRRQYEHLSSGSALAYKNSTDFYMKDSAETYERPSSNMDVNGGTRKLPKRSYSCVDGLSATDHRQRGLRATGGGGGDGGGSPPSAQLVRFRSQHFLSCVSGHQRNV